MRTTEWAATSNPVRFVDKRLQMRRDGPMRTLHVAAYRGVIQRRVVDEQTPRGRMEIEKCPHAHQKPSAARKCAQAAAKRKNKES